MPKLEFNDLFSFDSLKLGWERMIASVGSDVKDYFGISVYHADFDNQIELLSISLRNGKYAPSRPFKYFEPKKSGTQRTKTVLYIQDAIVYQTIGNHIAEKLYSHLAESKHHVFGSVLNPDVVKGVMLFDEEDSDYYFFEYYVNLYNRFIQGINDTLNEKAVKYRLETDITGFFDCIPHSTLLLILNDFKIDQSIINLLSTCLNIWSGTRDSPTYGVGIPQGPATSFLLANIILDGLDREVIKDGLYYFRFMDDIRIYGKTKKELVSILTLLDRHLKSKSLSINIKKTSIQEVSKVNDEHERILDSSGIPLTSEILDDIDVDIVNQDSTQLSTKEHLNFDTIDDEFASKIYKSIIKVTENELRQFYDEHKKNNPLNLDNDETRRFLTLCQKWRSTIKALRGIEEFEPNKNLVPIWLFGIQNVFWKTNAFVWNLQLYADLRSEYQLITTLISNFEDYEWVQYQTLAIFDKVIIEDSQKQRSTLKKLRESTSPLVRLGYYSALLETIKTNSQIFESVAAVLKEEPEEYVKNTVLNLIRRKHLDIPIESLKMWFL
jgi:hypothetical protein